MAPLFQRQNLLQQKAQRSLKQSVLRSPFILFAAVIFLLFLWIDTRDELLVMKTENPDVSQTVESSKQTPVLSKANSQVDLRSAQEPPVSSHQTQSRSARKHLESPDQTESRRTQKHPDVSSQIDVLRVQENREVSAQTDLSRTQEYLESNYGTESENLQEHLESSDRSDSQKYSDSNRETELRSSEEHPEPNQETELRSLQENQKSSDKTDLLSAQRHREQSYETDLRSSQEHHESSDSADFSRDQKVILNAPEYRDSSERTNKSSDPIEISNTQELLKSSDQIRLISSLEPSGSSSQTEMQECDGRRIFIYDLPAEFNDDLTKDCEKWHNWLEWSLCDDVANGGFGEQMNLSASDSMASILQPPSAWFETDQFSLEVTLHRRLKTYPCLTQDATQASIFYIPFYHALDLTRHIYNANLTTRDYLAKRMLMWVRLQPAFRRYRGHRHVITLGRVVWDFWRRDSEPWTGKWGSSIVAFPELGNVTKLFIERSPWIGSHQVAIPYPTSFHPSSDSELRSWQATVRDAPRPHLVSFAGSSRNRNMSGTVRGEVFDQCSRSSQCELLICTEEICHKTSRTIYKLALESVFCMQPPGDSPTRKGIFDSLLAGCIPVVFNRNQTVLQYLWHLTGDGSRYSVLIDGEAVINHYDVIRHLERMPRVEVLKLQASVVEIFPRILYRNPELKGEYTSKDAFDVIVESLLETFNGEDSRAQDDAGSRS